MRGRCRGFSMIEVLVAILVIGTGALAMVMLQLHALRSSQDSGLHARATLMAQELAELRSAMPHPVGTSDPFLFSLSPGKALPAQVDCELAACSPSDFTRAALADWTGRLVRDFPHARVTVCRDGRSRTPEDWQCDDQGSAPVVLKLGWRRIGAATPSTVASAPLLTLVLGH
ncbi:Type IV pilus modification protein PilV [Herbaspirillum rubrisubalbicans M1]|uniref:type IV pilus modification protein PilV n=1 Tax=Herbaspirillum rubrisubalbicans TaxID=80842 RepID=UPI00073A3931|nr:type IV pilus modification protein PilV [Herbaspirillum rubrisubalbicans]ALU90783.1 Type IV pilus modification protein PilV [Herbaspirillum rubrisubalbicans M1]